MSTPDTWPANKATQNASDNVAKYQEQIATVCGIGLQTVQQMQ